ncbi:MAG: glutamate 5-kinase, partial [Proteobacteria bacterium]|nr:glutamate 5-kinase [Pseudomonadota bacterium]
MTGSTHQRLARIVVKIGTGILTGGARTLDHARMADVARQIVEVRQSGVEVLLVSSGAIAAGRAHLALDGSRRDIPAKQMLAAIGQHRLMNVWDRIFADLGVTVAQTLLTKGDLRSRPGYLNTRN